VVFLIHELAIPVVLFYFVISSPLRAIWTRFVLPRWSGKSTAASSPAHP
jgi:hypothetical protein